MKLDTKQKQKIANKLVHAFGGCECGPGAKTCLYNKLVDEGVEAAVAAVIKEIEKL